MTNDALAKKLGLRMGMVASIEGAPPAYVRALSGYLDGSGRARFVQRFVKSKAELEGCVAGMVADEKSLVWVTYPKKSSGVESDLSREVVQDVMSPLGWIAVTIISVDDVWSALRFKPKGMVKTTRER